MDVRPWRRLRVRNAPAGKCRGCGAGAALVALLALSGCAPRGGSLLSGPAEIQLESAFESLRAAPLRVTGRAGEHFQVRLSQFDVDVGLELRGPDGRLLERTAGPAGRRGREWLYWQAATDGTFSVTITALDVPPPAARVRIELFRLPSDLPPDTQAALRSLQDAVRTVPAPEGAEARERYWVTAARAWENVRDRDLQAECLLQLGALRYTELQSWDRASEAITAALRLFEVENDGKAVADAALLLGMTELERERTRRVPESRSDGAPSLRLLQRARRGFQDLNLPVSAADALNNRGIKRYYGGDSKNALTDFSRAADEFQRARAIDDRNGALANLAAMAVDLGDYRRALQAFESQLESMPKTATHLRASALQNGALALSIMGETERSLDWYLQSIDIARRLGDPDLEARGLSGLGVAHLQFGQSALAVPHLRAAVDLLQRPGERDRLGAVLTHLGNALRTQGDVDEALRLHEEALRQLGSVAPPTDRMRALIGLGMDQAAVGRHALALRSYSQALGIRLTNPYSPLVSLALLERARAHAALGADSDARRDVDASIVLAARNEIADVHAIALIERARLNRDAGLDDAALADSERALRIAAPLRAATTNPDNRVLLAQRLRGAVDIQVSILAARARAAQQRGDHSIALDLARRSLAAVGAASARSSWLRPNARGRGLASEALYEALAGRRLRLAALADSATPQPERTRALEAEIAMLRSKLVDAARQRDVTDASPDSRIADVQSGLEADDALLVYWMSEPGSWLWIVTRDELRLESLAGAADIETASRRVLARIATLQRVDADVEQLARMLTAGNPPLLAGRSLLVVPDGVVAAVPWPLLQARLQLGGIVQLPGLEALSSPAAGDAPDRTRRVLLVGDPIYGADDARIAPQARRPNRDTTVPALPRLPGTAREIASIAALASPEMSETWIGAAATRAALLQADLRSVQVLHLAAHAALDPAVPELAAVVLTRFTTGGEPIPAELRASDVLRMNVVPRLVVLSACDAAAEPSVQANGMMNLTRAFLARGSRHVVASLWPAADASTAELMTEFYRHLLVDGESPEIALARAQATLAASSRWHAPFYWAGFVVLGTRP